MKMTRRYILRGIGFGEFNDERADFAIPNKPYAVQLAGDLSHELGAQPGVTRPDCHVDIRSWWGCGQPDSAGF